MSGRAPLESRNYGPTPHGANTALVCPSKLEPTKEPQPAKTALRASRAISESLGASETAHLMRHVCCDRACTSCRAAVDSSAEKLTTARRLRDCSTGVTNTAVRPLGKITKVLHDQPESSVKNACWTHHVRPRRDITQRASSTTRQLWVAVLLCTIARSRRCVAPPASRALTSAAGLRTDH